MGFNCLGQGVGGRIYVDCWVASEDLQGRQGMFRTLWTNPPAFSHVTDLARCRPPCRGADHTRIRVVRPTPSRSAV